MTTVQDIHDNLPFEGSGTSTTRTLKAVNAAIRAAYRRFWLRAYESNVDTIDDEQFEYDIDLTSYTRIDRNIGIARLTVTLANYTTTEAEVALRGCLQRFDHPNDQITVIIPPALANKYDGDALNLYYQYGHPAVTAVGDSVYLPISYVDDYVQYWYAKHFMSQATSDKAHWRKLLDESGNEWEKKLKTMCFVPSIGTLPLSVKDQLP